MLKYLPIKESSWKKNQGAKKRKQSLITLFKWFLVVVMLILLFLGFQIGKAIYSSIWDGVNRLTFALSIDKIALISYNPRGGEVVAILIPNDTQIEMTRGYGKYRITSIPKLEELEKRAGLLVESLQENLGVPIDGWVKGVDGESKSVGKEEVLAALSKNIAGGGDSNLSRWDLLRLWWQLKQLRFDKFNSINLQELGVLQPQELPDSTKVLGINSLTLDSQMQKLFFEPKIREEKLGIEVFNATTHPGLAERGARILSNIGANVEFVGNSDFGGEKCIVSTRVEAQKTYTVSKIIRIFSCDWIQKNEAGRADITLILGEDYWNKLTQK